MASFLVALAFHLKHIWPHKRKLKLGLYRLIDVYLTLMALRVLTVAAFWGLRDGLGCSEEDLILWFYPLQIDIY